MITNMPPEKLIELERAHGYWIGWVDGAFCCNAQRYRNIVGAFSVFTCRILLVMLKACNQ